MLGDLGDGYSWPWGLSTRLMLPHQEVARVLNFLIGCLRRRRRHVSAWLPKNKASCCHCMGKLTSLSTPSTRYGSRSLKRGNTFTSPEPAPSHAQLHTAEHCLGALGFSGRRTTHLQPHPRKMPQLRRRRAVRAVPPLAAFSAATALPPACMACRMRERSGGRAARRRP